MKLWKILNSPVVVVLITLIGLFIVISFAPSKIVSSQIRGAYEELNKVMQESVDQNKSHLVKEFAAEIAGQISEGFSQAFGSNNEDKGKETQKLIDIKKQLQITNLHIVPSQWETQQKFIGTLKNNSEHYLRMIKINLEFYNENNELIDAETKWMSDIKLLEPGEDFTFSMKRHLGNNKDKLIPKAAKIEAKVVSFDFAAKPEPKESQK